MLPASYLVGSFTPKSFDSARKSLNWAPGSPRQNLPNRAGLTVPCRLLPFLTELKGAVMISSILTYRVGLLLLIISVAISPAKADTIFDQTDTALPIGTLFQNLSVFSPMVQSFTPTMTSLNFVNLLPIDGSATVEVSILLGSISGTILGTSQPTIIPFSLAPTVSSFSFSTPAELVPGDLYVIEPFVVSGDTLIGSTDTNNYAGGNQILGGVIQPNNELWFQEGISVPEPGTLLLLGTGLIGLLAIVFFKNRSILHRLSPD